MTIRKGAAWGQHGALAQDGVLVRSDAEARAIVEHARREADASKRRGHLLPFKLENPR